ncbi:MAG: hypothetical protein KIH64_014285 [Mycobacterium sp.]|nr:hypothetical protein [Mycobacterium sp.]
MTLALTVATSPVAAADPTIPLDPGQLPGLEAMQSLSPVVQQAAGDPGSAQQLLLAAASQLAGNATTPEGSLALAQAVSKFVQQGGAAGLTPPAAAVTDQSGPAHGAMPLLTPGPGNGPIPLEQHVPAPGAIPGTEAHLPTGVNPGRAAGPAPEVPVMVPAPAAALAAPVPAAQPGPAPAPEVKTPYDPNTPPTQDFMYPSISNGCLKDGGNVIATAIAVAGPAKIPTPGPGAGQMAYVFTAVGTPAPAAEQKLPLNVTWVNLTTGKSGSATLKPNPGINPQGPTTLTAIVDTGPGSVMSTIFGQVTTLDKQCTFMPTIGSSVVP